MGIANKQHFNEGDIPTAAQLNAGYDSLQTQSAQINDNNTASGWITARHIYNAAPAANVLKSYLNPTTTLTAYNSTTYTTISQGGNPCEVTLGYQPNQWEITRFSASGLVGTLICNTTYDYVGANVGKPNYYAFRMLLTYDAGAGDVTETIGEWGYSFTPQSRLISDTTPGNYGELNPIQWQTFQFSTLRQHNGASGAVTYKKVELQIKVFDNTNTVRIARHQIFAIRGLT